LTDIIVLPFNVKQSRHRLLSHPVSATIDT